MLLSKMNYYVYVAFVLCAIAWRFLAGQGNRQTTPDEYRLHLKKGLLIAGVALCVWLPPVVYDEYVNDFRKSERLTIVAERFAAPEFKPSRLKEDLSASYWGLRLRDKGMTLKELLLQNPEWRNMTFKSFFGLYGNMDYDSDRGHYQAVTHMLWIFFTLVFFCVIIAVPVRHGIMILILLLFAGLTVGQSVYTSWVNDYQPQGRYLFALLPMLVIGLNRLPERFRSRVIPLFSLIFFVLSASSFLWTAIKQIPKLSGC